MSYNILDKYETLYEGVTYIQRVYPFYDKRKLVDKDSGDKYSVQMIKKCVDNSDFEHILQMILFDALIGNSDRHSNNWGIITGIDIDKSVLVFRFCPLYDNGSSLCAYEDMENINIFSNDNMKYEALINTKSKSTIGWNDIRPIRHFELIQHIRDEYFNLTEKYVKIIKEKLTDEAIQNILDNFDVKIINEDMKKLLRKFLLDRKNIILDIYNMKKEV